MLKGKGGYFRFIIGPRVPGVTLKSAGSSQVRLAINRAPGSACTRCCVTPSRCAASAVVIVLAAMFEG